MIIESSPWILLVAVPVIGVLVVLEIQSRRARSKNGD